jgi:hypothetical protein
LSIGQLPLVVVCAVVPVVDDPDEVDVLDDDVLDVAVEGVVVLVVAPVEALVVVRFAVAVAVAVGVVVADRPSRQANTPPNVSVAATLSVAAARRARAARGRRRGRRRVADVRSTVGSSMTTTVRTVHEGASRAGLERSKNPHGLGGDRATSRDQAAARDRAFHDQGITFSHSGEERAFPLDLVPRIIDSAEWAVVTTPTSRRSRAWTTAVRTTPSTSRWS